MSLRDKVNRIIISVATEVANGVSSHRNDQMAGDQQTLGKVIKIEDGTVTVQFANGSTGTGIMGIRTVVEGDTVSVIGGRIF